MYKIAKPLFIHCQTPMHAGSGDDLGIVDLPIQRESHTHYPKIEASSLKGAIRESFEEIAKTDDDFTKIHVAFGFDGAYMPKENVKKKFERSEDQDFAGALGFSDARLLLFPLKSMRGVFVWATCGKVLRRLSSEMSELCKKTTVLKEVDVPENKVIAADKAPLSIIGNKIQLEEYSFDIEDNADAKAIAAELATLTGITELKQKLVILPDDVFSYFVRNATEVVTRIKIDNATGTVASGALFTEEYLPAESVLYSLVLASDVFSKVGKEHFGSGEAEKVMAYIETIGKVIQIGGNATLGKGIVKTKIA
ncbi:MAG: type III-B CRISPR module RAMP protein Cmr4 [Saprospiraceae bacterium]|nr:type III-B CRISPR module RAMP protein Cmr4 [Saprospiraceae bacterium]